QALGRLAEAEACQRENVEICRRLLEKRAELANPVAAAQNNRGLLLRALGRLVQAEQCHRESVAIRRRLVEVEKRGDLASHLATALGNHGSGAQALGGDGG